MSSKSSVNFRDFDFDFKYNYSPEEKQTHDHPGYPEEFEIFDITLNDIDASYLLQECIEEFEQVAIDSLKSY
jgi:hypothetical protein